MPAAKNPAAKAMNSPTMGSRRSVREPIGFTPAKKETPAPPPMRTPPPKMAPAVMPGRGRGREPGNYGMPTEVVPPGERIMPAPSNPREVFVPPPRTPPSKMAPEFMPGRGRGMGNYVIPPPGEVRLMVDPAPPTGRGFKPGQGPGMGPPPPPMRTTPPRQMQPDKEYALGKSPVKPPVKSPGGAVRKISAKY